MVKLRSIEFSSDGKKITYDYEVSSAAARYFNAEKLFVEFDVDVSAVPASIAVIPLLCNLMPIAWFAGFDVEIPEVDEDFFRSLEALKTEWSRHYPMLLDRKSTLTVANLVGNRIEGEKPAMLFSGGVDAFATYFRHFEQTPDLITIQGADIELTDDKQWADVKRFNESEPILKQNAKHYIRTNFQQFYTHKVDYLLPNLGWWGNVQHGMALIGITAPLSWVEKYHTIYIASTRSVHMEFNAWGSMPEIDNLMKWAGLQTIHDGFELKRQDKVDTIVDAVGRLQKETTIRVCYSELKNDLNCSRCEKCVRTIFGIMMAGGNPKTYGFQADVSIYEKVIQAMSRGFKSRGNQFFWEEIAQKAASAREIFVFGDPEAESVLRKKALESVEIAIRQPLVKSSPLKKIKHSLIKSYPGLFQKYLEIRRKL